MGCATATNGDTVDVYRMARRDDDLVRVEIHGYVNPARDQLTLDLSREQAVRLGKRLIAAAK